MLLVVGDVRRTLTGAERVCPTTYGAIASIKVERAHERAKNGAVLPHWEGRTRARGRGALTPGPCRAGVSTASGREEITAAVMLAPGQGVPLSEQVVPAPETAMEMTDRDVGRVESKNKATWG